MRRVRTSRTGTRRRCCRTSRPGARPRSTILNGGIARFGRELGVPTPLNDTITALIKGVEASWQQS